MKKTSALILPMIAAVLALLALVFYLTSGIVMNYVVILSAAALAFGVLCLALYGKFWDRVHFPLLASAASVLSMAAFAFSLISEVETLGYLVSGLRQWKDVQNWAFFAVASLLAWILYLIMSFAREKADRA